MKIERILTIGGLLLDLFARARAIKRERAPSSPPPPEDAREEA
jgi:hypothetical protein